VLLPARRQLHASGAHHSSLAQTSEHVKIPGSAGTVPTPSNGAGRPNQRHTLRRCNDDKRQAAPDRGPGLRGGPSARRRRPGAAFRRLGPRPVDDCDRRQITCGAHPGLRLRPAAVRSGAREPSPGAVGRRDSTRNGRPSAAMPAEVIGCLVVVVEGEEGCAEGGALDEYLASLSLAND
jgi:hypothetical protein